MSCAPPPTVVVSADASCSGRRATCAAVLMEGERIVAECSRWLREVDGYVLAAEIGAVALAGELVAAHAAGTPVVVEVDNPQVPRVLLECEEPPQAGRIPADLLSKARAFVCAGDVAMHVLPRNASFGLRRADRLASKRLWRR